MSAPELDVLRFDLDRLDDQIVELLVARFRRLERLSQVNAREGLDPVDPVRETAVLARVEKSLAGLDVETRYDVMEVVRAVLERGRAHTKRRTRELRARHDRGNGNVAVDPEARRDPARGGSAG